MSNGSLNTSRTPGAVACRVYPKPGLSIVRLSHCPTPVPVTVKVPPRVNVPPLGLKPSESVASPAYDRSWLPASSYTVTRTARIECPAWVIAGWSVNRRKRPEPGGGGGGGATKGTKKEPRQAQSAGTVTYTGFATGTELVFGS